MTKDKNVSPKTKKILMRALLILGGIFIIFIVLFGGIKANDYWQVKKLVKASDDLVKQEKYQDAYNNLGLTQARWTTAKMRKEIETKISLEQQLIADADNYTAGNDLFGQSKWQEAKDSYSKISSTYPHYQEAQDKIKECQSKIDEANAKSSTQTNNSSARREASPATNSTTEESTSQNQTDYNNCVQQSDDNYRNLMAQATETVKQCGDFNNTADGLQCLQNNASMVAIFTSSHNSELAACIAKYPNR